MKALVVGYGHMGRFHAKVLADLGYEVAVMSNYDPPAAMHVAGKLRSLIGRK